MRNQYIEELIERLYSTEIYIGAGKKCADYNEGIRCLVDFFQTPKRDRRSCFL